jgi:hypothetical protein
MSTEALTKEAIVRRGEALYDSGIRQKVEPANKGRYLALDLGTSEFEIADSVLAANDAIRARVVNPVLYFVRIGYPAVYRFGAADLRNPE